MKKFTILILTILSAVSSAYAGRKVVAPVGIDSLSFGRDGSRLDLDMELNLKPADVASCNAMVLTPIVLTFSGDSLSLPSVLIYGRQRYINYLRTNASSNLKDGDKVFRASVRPDSYGYHASLPYDDSLNGCQLLMRRSLYGCANSLVDEKFDYVGQYMEWEAPEKQLKYAAAENIINITDTLSGKAYIDFVVNKMNIEPNYRSNARELMKIQQTIDTALNDDDVRITSVWLKGFASPEGSYARNTELSIGRTEALKQYISQLYKFEPGIIATDYEPEDWDGLSDLVAKSNLSNKAELLKIINSDMAPDAKEAFLAKRFPTEYSFIHDNFYPPLRHTEYKVICEVKHFDDINKIREVMRTKPNRLTLREFYLLGNACIPGSDEFNEVYETAVRMYPDDPVANINAANAALQRGDLVSAERYLAKAGDSDDAVFARATLAFQKEDFDAAEKLLDTLPNMPAARNLLDEIAALKSRRAKSMKSIMLE